MTLNFPDCKVWRPRHEMLPDSERDNRRRQCDKVNSSYETSRSLKQTQNTVIEIQID